MKKILLLTAALFAFSSLVFADVDDDLFGGSFDDDEFFFDDGIVELETAPLDSRTEELNHGTLFETGSIKIGGTWSTSIGTSTVLYKDDNKTFADNLKDTTLSPAVNALLTIDARPSQVLRMYSKFGIDYPYALKAVSTADTSKLLFPILGKEYLTTVNTTVTDWLKVKELFTDFSVADRAFFRFGLHTVTWGTGFFFSPVSDMINTSSIDPENTDAQVEGSVNLRTQITFPGTQNCLWLYVIPSTDFINSFGTTTYLRDTALAGKADLVFGGWEFGVGGFYKYQNAPKAMLTASGSLKKMSMFGEAVFQYGADSEWKDHPDDWKDNKTCIFQGSVGLSYIWKTPSITLAAQYYFDSNDVDLVHNYFTNGHNLAAVVNFGRIFGTTDLTATVFGMVNFGKEKIPSAYLSIIEGFGISDTFLSTATFSAMLNYSPINSVRISAGPYVTFPDWDSKPAVAMKLNFTLGGGKF